MEVLTWLIIPRDTIDLFAWNECCQLALWRMLVVRHYVHAYWECHANLTSCVVVWDQTDYAWRCYIHPSATPATIISATVFVTTAGYVTCSSTSTMVASSTPYMLPIYAITHASSIEFTTMDGLWHLQDHNTSKDHQQHLYLPRPTIGEKPSTLSSSGYRTNTSPS